MVVYKSKLTYDGSIMVALNFWLHRFGLMDALSDDGLRKRFYRNWTKDGPFAIIANNIINIWLQISNHFITLVPNLINIYHPLNISILRPMTRSWRSHPNNCQKKSHSKDIGMWNDIFCCFLKNIKAPNIASGAENC